MKGNHLWKQNMVESGARHRPQMKRPIWIIALLSMVSLFLVCVYVYPPRSSNSCYFFSSNGCQGLTNWLPPSPAREFSDEEITSRIVLKEILKFPPVSLITAKIAFMFLTPGSLPFEKLWDKFFQGHDGRFTVYIHASKEKPIHTSRHFIGREILSTEVLWGEISMIDAERRLLANALEDPYNQQFVLISDSCIPLHKFEYVYNYLMHTNLSFVDSFYDPGPHGTGRYINKMLPEIEKKHFHKGAQWFALKRQHAVMVLADNLYYSKFRDYCKHGVEGMHCIPDEHYMPTLFNLVDAGGIANWSVTHVDWSERKWHPKSYMKEDISYALLANISSVDMSVHVSSDEEGVQTVRPCTWNGIRRPCFLFARKFHAETLETLLQMYPNYTATL